MSTIHKLFLCLCALFAVAACTTPQPEQPSLLALSQSQIDSLPPQVQWPVTHLSQLDDYSCATTAMAMAVNYFRPAGTPALDQATSWKLSGSKPSIIRRLGNDMAGLASIAQAYKLRAEYLERLDLPRLEYLLARGALVILNIHTGAAQNTNHAVLATGYDQASRRILIEDPADQRAEISFDALPNLWTAFLSLPRGQSTQSGFVVYGRDWK